MRTLADIDLTTHDLYFRILVKVFMKHILAKDTYFTNHTEWTECKIMVLKPASKYKIIQQCPKKNSYWQLPASSISLLSKGFVNIIFHRVKIILNHLFIYYLIYSGAREVFCKIIFFKAWFPLAWNEMWDNFCEISY